MFRAKFFTVTSIALGGYFAGLATDRYLSPLTSKPSLNTECQCIPESTSTKGLLPKPALPVFGTVSAASMVPASSNPSGVKAIPAEPAPNASRVAQVVDRMNQF